MLHTKQVDSIRIYTRLLYNFETLFLYIIQKKLVN